MPFDATGGVVAFLGQSVVNEDPRARLAIANRLLDDGADPSLVSTNGDRGDGLNVTGTTVVPEIYSELSTLIASYGALAQRDTGEFDQLGVNIEVQDAQRCEVSQ